MKNYENFYKKFVSAGGGRLLGIVIPSQRMQGKYLQQESRNTDHWTQSAMRLFVKALPTRTSREIC